MIGSTAPDHAWIEAHIPHKGGMCLLERVTAWDEQHICCRAVSHRAPDNPLRAHGRLGAVCGVEYAAQAMAVHGALLAPAGETQARVGYLVSVRGVRLLAERLDDIDTDLEIKATCLMRGENNLLYEFEVTAGDRLLVAGRAAVMLNAEGAAAAAGAPA